MTTYTAEAVHETLEVAVTAALEKSGLEHLADAVDWDIAAELECEHRGWGYTTSEDGTRTYYDGHRTPGGDDDYLYDLHLDRQAS